MHDMYSTCFDLTFFSSNLKLPLFLWLHKYMMCKMRKGHEARALSANMGACFDIAVVHNERTVLSINTYCIPSSPSKAIYYDRCHFAASVTA